jgi:hypothetical protein
MKIYLEMDNSCSAESCWIFLFMLYFGDIVIEYTNILRTSDRVRNYFRYKW